MITFCEALELYENAPLASLMAEAHSLRRKIKGTQDIVTYQKDCNVNITNVCCSGCKFCTFHCRLSQREKGYITTLEEYQQKFAAMERVGANQILLQGGMHPELGLEYYEELFAGLKSIKPTLKLHALGPPEIFYLAKKAKISVQETLERLVTAGLDSLPGAGAEILDDEWRAKYTPAKCSAQQWLQTMEVAHRMGLLTSATMMYGFCDSPSLRIKHLFALRDLQEKTGGFRAFIPWPHRAVGSPTPSGSEYLRIIAISRLVLTNVENIQASWLTVGTDVGQVALHGGANDLGSIMIEENVVRSAGVTFTMDEERMRTMIERSGFTPQLRNQAYEYL